MTKTIRVSLSEDEYLEIAGQATREKRTINQQAAYMLNSLMPTMKVRRAADQPGENGGNGGGRDPSTDPQLDLPKINP